MQTITNKTMNTKFSLSILAFAFALGILPQQAKAKRPKATKDTLTIISFNDFHGAFQEEGDVPGAARLAATIQQIRQEYPNVIVVAGGDNYSGGYFPRITQGRPLKEFFEACQVEYSAIGNHEFDWGIPAMIERLHWGPTRYIAANIFYYPAANAAPQPISNATSQPASKATPADVTKPAETAAPASTPTPNPTAGKPARLRPDWAIPYAIKHDTLRNGTPVRIAFIGLSTQETKTAALPEIVKDLDFADPVPVAAQIAEQLQDSAELHILLAHIGTDNQDGRIIFTDAGTDGLSRIEGIDGIISGHSHKIVCGLKDSMPIVQARNYGRKLALLQYEISRDKKGHIQSRFLGARLMDPGQNEDPDIQRIVNQYLNDLQYGFQNVICQNQQAMNPEDLIPGSGFCLLGSLVTQSYQDCYLQAKPQDSNKIVIGVCNYGAIRTILPEGPVNKLQAGNIIPFGGVLNAFHLNGQQVRQLFQYGINRDLGWLQYHDMEITLDAQDRIQSIVYTGNGQRIPIQDTGNYIIVTENFLSSGGDGYPTEVFRKRDEAFAKTDPARRNPTDVFILYLKKLESIDAKAIRVPKTLHR